MAVPPQDQVADLGALLDAGEGAIVVLVSGETRLAAHTSVLAANSPVFSAMFRHDMLKATTGQVAIPDVEGLVLRQLLAFMYTGRAPQLASMARPLLAAADKYGLGALKASCEQQVVAQLDMENAAAAAVLSVRHSCPTLREAALNFVRGHIVQVMATQGWAEALRRQPEDVVEVSRLLAEAPPEASGPATAADPAAAPTTTSTAADPQSTAGRQTPPPNATAVSRFSTPATADSTPDAAAAVPPAARPLTPPPDDAAISRFRSLSAEEKGRRLREAAKAGAVEDVRALLAAGADVGAAGLAGYSALHLVACRGHVEVAQRLLEAWAAVGARKRWQETPLHWAAGEGHAAVVRLLLAASADPDARDVREMAPLHWAAVNGHAEAAAALLEGGADRGARDRWGETALDLARKYNWQQVVDLLLANA